MEYLLLVFLLIDTILLVGIANLFIRMFGKNTNDKSYQAGYNEGSLDTVYFIRRNLTKHQDIIPSWMPEWFDKMIIAYKTRQDNKGLSDISMKYEGQSDYSNVLEMQKVPSDIKITRDL